MVASRLLWYANTVANQHRDHQLHLLEASWHNWNKHTKHKENQIDESGGTWPRWRPFEIPMQQFIRGLIIPKHIVAAMTTRTLQKRSLQ